MNMVTKENKMKISASDLYIIATHVSYDGISGDTENIYTDKAEAEKAAAERSNLLMLGSSLKYAAMTLDDYIDEVKQDARWQGEMNQRNRD